MIASVHAVVVDWGIHGRLSDGAALVVEVHGELPDRVCHMEVMLPLNNLREFRPDLCRTSEAAGAGEDGDDIGVPVGPTVLYLTCCVRIVGEHAFVVHGYVATGRDVQEGIVEVLRLPDLVGFTVLAGLVECVPPLLENGSEPVSVQPAHDIHRRVCNETVSGNGVHMVSHVMQLVDAADQHAPHQGSGVGCMVGARDAGWFRVFPPHLFGVIACLRTDILPGLSIAAVDHCLDALLYQGRVPIQELCTAPVLHEVRDGVREALGRLAVLFEHLAREPAEDLDPGAKLEGEVHVRTGHVDVPAVARVYLHAALDRDRDVGAVTVLREIKVADCDGRDQGAHEVLPCQFVVPREVPNIL